MRAQDLMSHPVITVRPQDTVRDAAALLAKHGLTALPVVNGPVVDGGDTKDKLVGIVTEADLMRERVHPDPRSGYTLTTAPPQTVGEVMTTDVVAMTVGADVAELARTILDRGLRAIPIVDADRLVGMVTRRDLIRCIGRDDATVTADVRHRLEVYGGPGRWTVTARAGRVTITDEYDDPTDLHVAHVLASAVPGVSSVEVSSVADRR
jgi:CBS domain-containing protein